MYFKEIVSDIVGFKSRINQHISDCRASVSISKFPIHIYKYGLKNKCLKESLFDVRVELKSIYQL